MRELTSAEVADLLGVTPGRVRQLLAAGALRSRKVGNTRLVAERELERFTKLPASKSGPKAKS